LGSFKDLSIHKDRQRQAILFLSINIYCNIRFVLSCSEDRRPESAAPAAGGDAHASLMAAIRQAGGAGRAKLRSSVEPTTTKVNFDDQFKHIHTHATQEG
jgi:hypothetical protein